MGTLPSEVCWWSSRFALLAGIVLYLCCKWVCFYSLKEKTLKNKVRISLQSLEPSILFIQITIYEFPSMGPMWSAILAFMTLHNILDIKRLLFELIFMMRKNLGFFSVFSWVVIFTQRSPIWVWWIKIRSEMKWKSKYRVIAR